MMVMSGAFSRMDRTLKRTFRPPGAGAGDGQLLTKENILKSAPANPSGGAGTRSPNANMAGANPSAGSLRDTTWGRAFRDRADRDRAARDRMMSRSLRNRPGTLANMIGSNPSAGVNGTMAGIPNPFGRMVGVGGAGIYNPNPNANPLARKIRGGW
jgi:hypothetical protein